MRKSLKQLLVMTLIMITALAAVPVRTEAATFPAKISRALERAVDENGRAIIVDQKAGKMYLFKRNCKSKKWELKRTFSCIVSEKLCKTKHYMLHRSPDLDMYAWGEDYERWSYGMIVDCYERPACILIHSYTERYIGEHWVKNKSKTGNTFGIATCEENARYIWRYYTDGTAVMGV